MGNNELEIFVHTRGERPKVITAAPEQVLRDVLVRHGVIAESQHEMLCFVGECQEALKESDSVDDGADEHTPVNSMLTLDALDLRKHRHVHCHECRYVVVEVNFGGRTTHRKFSPATTVEVVEAWARRKFHIDAAAAAEYVLQVTGSTEQPRADKHLGELVEKTKCAISFDLVKELTPQG